MVIILDLFTEFMEFLNIDVSTQEFFIVLKLSLNIILVTLVSYFSIRYLFMKLFIKFTKKTKTKWDDYLIERGFFQNFSFLLPLGILHVTLSSHSFYLGFVEKSLKLLIILVIVRTIQSMLHTFEDIYNTYEISKEKPIKSYLQIINIFVVFSAIII